MKHTSPGSAAILAVAVACLTGGAIAANAAVSSGNLNLLGTLRMVSIDAPCPAGMSASTICHSRTARGQVSGLGEVTQAYWYNGEPAPCPPGETKILGYTTSFRVTGKGEIHVAVAETPDCLTANVVALNATQLFTVTGGTGIYAGASGSGRIERAASFAPGGAAGRDTWIGTLAVPGLEFDVTRPTVAGAANRTVKAKKGARSARVAFRLTAQDDRDGSLPVTCTPRSGSRFPLGKTKVACSATDSSANTGAATFTVTVKRAR
jgi:hypothetical protein